MKLEVCIDNIEDVYLCNEYSDIISRVELNQALGLGGLTPSLELVKKTRELLDNDIDLVCMIRLRAGDFNYTDNEFDIMFKDAERLIPHCSGIVFGALNEKDEIDIEKTRKMIDLAHSHYKEFVFHRAIDVSNDYHSSIKVLNDLNIDRLLTSGHKKNAVVGLKNIEKIDIDCEILIGCGINSENIHLFKDHHVHGSFSEKIKTPFGAYQRLSKNELEKIRETKYFKKSNTLFIHGAGLNACKENGDSLYELIKNPNLVNFTYNQNLPIIKDLQKKYDVQLYGIDGIDYLVNYKFKSDDIKYVCGHSVGAYNVIKAFATGAIDIKNIFNRKYPENVDLIELGAPKISEIKEYIEDAAKRAKFVLIELIEDDKLELALDDVNSIAAIQYGDRSVKEFERIFKNIKLPKNVFVLKINKIDTDSNEYLANVLLNHALLFKKGSEINKKIQKIRLEFIEIIKNKGISYNQKLKKLRELEEEFNQKYIQN